MPESNMIHVHGAANSSAVWQFWQHELAALGWSTNAVDLRGHGARPTADLSRFSMHIYVAGVRLGGTL